MSMDADVERALVERARLGDAQAFGELALIHQTFVYNLALRALGDANEARDVAQEAFLRAWRGLPGFRAQAGFRTWLYRIVVNLCYNRSPGLRRACEALSLDAATAADDPAAAPLDERLPTAAPGPEAALEAAETRRLLHRLIEALPANYRVLTLLRYTQELSYEEIAAVTRLPLGTVKTGLHRAHQRLRQDLLAATTVSPVSVAAELNLSVEGGLR